MRRCEKRCVYDRSYHDVLHERYRVRTCRTCGRKDYTPAHLIESVSEQYWKAMFPRGVR